MVINGIAIYLTCMARRAIVLTRLVQVLVFGFKRITCVEFKLVACIGEITTISSY